MRGLSRHRRGLTSLSYGKDHPDVARDLNNLGLLLQATNRLAEAEPLYRHATLILARSLGWDHPNTQTVSGELGRFVASARQKDRSGIGKAAGGGAEIPFGVLMRDGSRSVPESQLLHRFPVPLQSAFQAILVCAGPWDWPDE